MWSVNSFSFQKKKKSYQGILAFSSEQYVSETAWLSRLCFKTIFSSFINISPFFCKSYLQLFAKFCHLFNISDSKTIGFMIGPLEEYSIFSPYLLISWIFSSDNLNTFVKQAGSNFPNVSVDCSIENTEQLKTGITFGEIEETHFLITTYLWI